LHSDGEADAERDDGQGSEPNLQGDAPTVR